MRSGRLQVSLWLLLDYDVTFIFKLVVSDFLIARQLLIQVHDLVVGVTSRVVLR